MKYSSLIILSIIAVIITDSFYYINSAGHKLGTTYLSTFLNYSSIILFIVIAYKAKNKHTIPTSIQLLFKFWLFWMLFNIVRAAFIAEDYWDWKFLLLSALSFSLITLIFYVGNNLFYVKRIVQFVLKYVFLYGFILIPLALVTHHELYSRIMIPISFFIVLAPYLKLKWKLLIGIVAITSILIFVGFRMNIVKTVFSLILLLLFYFRAFISFKLFEIGRIFLFILPLLLFVMAIFGKYNLFNELAKNGETTVSFNNQYEENLMADTRTFLYIEVLATLNKSGNWLMGESPSKGYNSVYFYNSGGAMKGTRYRTEVNILNILLYHGIIGVVLYFLLLYRVSYIAIAKSNNMLAKMLGLFIAFRWTLSFIEEYTQYDLNFYFFWLIMGLLSSSTFRNMTDTEVRNYLTIK